jgi:hypothetical protein
MDGWVTVGGFVIFIILIWTFLSILEPKDVTLARKAKRAAKKADREFRKEEAKRWKKINVERGRQICEDALIKVLRDYQEYFGGYCKLPNAIVKVYEDSKMGSREHSRISMQDIGVWGGGDIKRKYDVFDLARKYICDELGVTSDDDMHRREPWEQLERASEEITGVICLDTFHNKMSDWLQARDDFVLLARFQADKEVHRYEWSEFSYEYWQHQSCIEEGDLLTNLIVGGEAIVGPVFNSDNELIYSGRGQKPRERMGWVDENNGKITFNLQSINDNYVETIQEYLGPAGTLSVKERILELNQDTGHLKIITRESVDEQAEGVLTYNLGKLSEKGWDELMRNHASHVENNYSRLRRLNSYRIRSANEERKRLMSKRKPYDNCADDVGE